MSPFSDGISPTSQNIVQNSKNCVIMRCSCFRNREFAVVEAWQTCPNPIWGSFYFSEFFHYGTDRRTKSTNR
ncbi:predicted protein [Neisseria gonorrhoeae PID332]|nr:predicted protein [Neisseria gonorrhoeae PID332]